MKHFYIVSVLLLLLHKTTISQTYTFIGSGLWTVSANWNNNSIPPNPLPAGNIIYISPAAGDSCVLNVSQTISPGGSLIISPGAHFVVGGGVVINNGIVTSSTIICNQVWMTKNLSVSRYRNGDIIPHVTNNSLWPNLTIGAWCWYNNDSVNYSKYGKLYNWYAVNDPRGLAPEGWRVPDSMDIEALISCYGSKNVGGALKDTGTLNWLSPNTGASNIYNFNAIAHGIMFSGLFSNNGAYAYWWLNSAVAPTWQTSTILSSYTSALDFSSGARHHAYPVRCLKDTVVNTADFPVVATTTAVSSITATTAVSGGSILSDGGYPIIEKGVVWDTLPNPDVTDAKTIDGNGLADYVSNMALLLGNHTYYVRAYARNQWGVGYGTEISFTTLSVLPATVVTLPILFYKDTMFYGRGGVSNSGGGILSDAGVVVSTQPGPTVSDIKCSKSGGYLYAFEARCGSLLPHTVYYVRAYAVNEAGVSYGNELSFTTAAASPGNVIINNQVWMARNLDVSTYRNGDTIPQARNGAEWAYLSTGAWCWYNDDSATYAATYGKLYNWYAVNDPRGLAPDGWHIPTRDDMNQLAAVFGGYNVAGAALKEAGTQHWAAPNYGATNISGFTALPGGHRTEGGGSSTLGTFCNWWGAASLSTSYADMYYINAYGAQLVLSNYEKSYGFSVRCIKD